MPSTSHLDNLYVVQAWNGKRWAKVRGVEGGPWRLESRAQRIAEGRERSPRRTSSTEGMPHRVVPVVQRATEGKGS